MNNDNKFIYITIAAVIAIFVVIALINKGDGTPAGAWEGTDIACLPNGHQNLAMHIHPTISISVDGVMEAIPANIGLNSGCMAEVHTHEADGVIHIESITNKTFVLGDFFEVWGKEIDRSGYQTQVLADGKEVEDPSGLTLLDLQKIEVIYTSATSTTATTQ